jgi:hypothetical protein
MKDETVHCCTSAIRRLQALPFLNSFHQTVTDILTSGDVDAFWNCQEEFAAILRPDCLRDLVNYELESFKNNARYMPDKSNEQTLTLVETGQYALELKLVYPGTEPSVIHSFPQHTIFGLVSKGPVSFDLFTQPSPFPNDVFDRTRTLVSAGGTELSARNYVCLRAGYDLFALKQSQSEQIYLIFKSRNLLRLIWWYSAATLIPVRAVAADQSSCRLQYAARLLAAMSCRESIPNLLGLLEHPDHFVRWTAIQTIIRLDLEKGISALGIGLSDAHPHVRDATARAMTLLRTKVADRSN